MWITGDYTMYAVCNFCKKEQDYGDTYLKLGKKGWRVVGRQRGMCAVGRKEIWACRPCQKKGITYYTN